MLQLLVDLLLLSGNAKSDSCQRIMLVLPACTCVLPYQANLANSYSFHSRWTHSLQERKRERERERRLDAKDAHGVKKSKLTRDRDRDISEKIALGQANVGATGQPMYDQRLFNQDTGVASGLGADDTYNVYDKALFADKGSGLYRPNKQVDDDEVPVDADKDGRRFKPDKGFSGVDYGAASRQDTGPVQFEREAEEADPFGLDKFADNVRGSRKKNALESIGGGGAMRAGGGGGKYEDYAGGSSRSQVQFERSRH